MHVRYIKVYNINIQRLKVYYEKHYLLIFIVYVKFTILYAQAMILVPHLITGRVLVKCKKKMKNKI